MAWPRILHAGSIVHIGNAHFDEARAGAEKALGMQNSGTNAQIILAPTTDTMADYTLWNAVSCFRRHMNPELVTPSRKRKPRPAGVLITRLEQVCWTYIADGTFRDGEGGTIHILLTVVLGRSPPVKICNIVWQKHGATW